MSGSRIRVKLRPRSSPPTSVPLPSALSQTPLIVLAMRIDHEVVEIVSQVGVTVDLAEDDAAVDSECSRMKMGSCDVVVGVAGRLIPVEIQAVSLYVVRERQAAESSRIKVPMPLEPSSGTTPPGS